MFSSTRLEKSIITYLKSSKNTDARVSQVIHILVQDVLITEEDTSNHIHFLKVQQHSNISSFNDLLIGLLLVKAEEYKESLDYFYKFIRKESTQPISIFITYFIALIKLSELNDKSDFINAVPNILDAIDTKENIIPLLWNLSEMLNIEKDPEPFQKLLNRAKERYPYERKLHILQGWVCQKRKNSTALELAIIQYKKCIKALRSDINYDHYNFELAELNHFVALCYLSMPTPQIDKIVEYCDLALFHDNHTEEYSIEEDIRKTKASAALCHKSLQCIKLDQNEAARIIMVSKMNTNVLVNIVKHKIVCPN